MMRDKLAKILAIAVAVMGGVHIFATFTPLISGGLEVLSQARQNAMIYMSLMCGALLIVCGLLVSLLHDRVKEHSFLRLPYRIILLALVADGIAAVGFMSHNPFAWVVFMLIACLAIATLCQNKK